MKRTVLILLLAALLAGCTAVDNGRLFNDAAFIFGRHDNSAKDVNPKEEYVDEQGAQSQKKTRGIIYDIIEETLYIHKDFEWDPCEEMPWVAETEKLKKIVVEEGVSRLNEFVFSGCERAESISLPKSLKEIESHAFNGCYALKEIALPEGLQTIDDFALSCCGIETLLIPASVREIGANPVTCCINLKQIVVQEENTRYSSCGCNVIFDKEEKRLLSFCATSRIPEGMEIIGERAFQDYGMDSIEIPDTVRRIEDCAFCGSAVKTITIPASVDYIGVFCFDCCKQLQAVEFAFAAETVKVDDWAFTGCENLKTVRFNGREFTLCSEVFDSGVSIIR